MFINIHVFSLRQNGILLVVLDLPPSAMVAQMIATGFDSGSEVGASAGAGVDGVG